MCGPGTGVATYEDTIVRMYARGQNLEFRPRIAPQLSRDIDSPWIRQ